MHDIAQIRFPRVAKLTSPSHVCLVIYVLLFQACTTSCRGGINRCLEGQFFRRARTLTGLCMPLQIVGARECPETLLASSVEVLVARVLPREMSSQLLVGAELVSAFWALWHRCAIAGKVPLW